MPTHVVRHDPAAARIAEIVTVRRQGGSAMPTYIILANFTDQGVRNAKHTVKRAEAFKDLAKKHGVTVKDIYWAQGRYDIVTISEAADEMSATALALSLGGQGNIRTETLRAFSAEDMKTIIGKMA